MKTAGGDVANLESSISKLRAQTGAKQSELIVAERDEKDASDALSAILAGTLVHCKKICLSLTTSQEEMVSRERNYALIEALRSEKARIHKMVAAMEMVASQTSEYDPW